jgi:hypothetical protein
VVRLKVVQYDIPDLIIVAEQLKPLEERLGELLFDGIHDRDAFAASDQVGVI